MAVTAAPLRRPRAALHFIAFLQDARSKQRRQQQRLLQGLTLYYGNNARGRRMLVSKVTRVATMLEKKEKKKVAEDGKRRETFFCRRSIRESLLPASTRLTVAFWLLEWKKKKNSPPQVCQIRRLLICRIASTAAVVIVLLRLSPKNRFKQISQSGESGRKGIILPETGKISWSYDSVKGPVMCKIHFTSIC